MKRWAILLIVFMALVVLLASLSGVDSVFAQGHRHNSPRRDSEKRFSEWSEPVNLGAKVNSAFNDWFPAISPNGLSLYISSNRPGGFGAADIWVSQRASLDDPWGGADEPGIHYQYEHGRVYAELLA